jgi:phage shock protein A
MKTIRQEYEEQRQENEDLRKEYARLAKKYTKTKEKRSCEKCRGGEAMAESLEKEREIYLNDRKMQQDEIKSLRQQLENS